LTCMAQQVAKIKLTKLLSKNHLTALEKNQLTLTIEQKFPILQLMISHLYPQYEYRPNEEFTIKHCASIWEFYQF